MAWLRRPCLLFALLLLARARAEVQPGPERVAWRSLSRRLLPETAQDVDSEQGVANFGTNVDCPPATWPPRPVEPSPRRPRPCPVPTTKPDRGASRRARQRGSATCLSCLGSPATSTRLPGHPTASPQDWPSPWPLCLLQCFSGGLVQVTPTMDTGLFSPALSASGLDTNAKSLATEIAGSLLAAHTAPTGR